MVEVFKTNVSGYNHAKMIIVFLNKIFPAFQINFDLDDCDHILRVKSNSSTIQYEKIISIVRDLGFYAEVLKDEIPVGVWIK